MLVIGLTAGPPAEGVGRRASSVSLTATAKAVVATPSRFSGRVSPATVRPLTLQRSIGGRWFDVARTRSHSNGSFSFGLPNYAAATSGFRVVLPATRRYRSTLSRAVRVQVTTPSRPLGSPRAFTFLLGEVARWDPCTTITYRVNPNGAPVGWHEEITEALRRLSVVTGLRYKDLGTTTHLPGRNDGVETGAMLDIGYSAPGQSSYVPVSATRDGLGGVGGAQGQDVYTATQGWQVQLTSGFAVLNLGMVRKLRPGFGGALTPRDNAGRGQLLMHELAHATGLGHAPDSAADRVQIMFPHFTGYDARWGAGDVTALTAVGSGSGCVVATTPPPGSTPYDPASARRGPRTYARVLR